MSLVKWEPLTELANLRREMNRFFGPFASPDYLEFTEDRFMPSVDISENKNDLFVKVDAPGVEAKDLSVTLSGENLLIKGERKEEKEEKDKHFHRVERSYGEFKRVLPLPVSVEEDKIKAEYKKGVLEIHLLKKEEAKTKEIPVKIN